MLRKLNDMDTLPGCKPIELWPSPGSEASLDMRSWDLTGEALCQKKVFGTISYPLVNKQT